MNNGRDAALREDSSESVAGPTLVSTVSERLRAAIISGELAPGAKVNIDRVRTLLGVSLSPLREALSRLASEGFLTAQDNRGYRVADVSLPDLHQIIALRLELETFALQKAIALGDEDWEKAVLDSLATLVSTRRGANAETNARWERAHLQFHLQLLRGCGMPLLQQFTRTLHDLNDRYRRIFLQVQEPPAQTLTEHVELATAATERRTEDAIECLRRHLQGTGTRIADILSAR